MSEETCECKNCKKTFIRYINDEEKECPYCKSKEVKIIDIAF